MEYIIQDQQSKILEQLNELKKDSSLYDSNNQYLGLDNAYSEGTYLIKVHDNKAYEIEIGDDYSLGTDNKLHKANELKCDIFIEDHPNNALNLANGGIKVILIDCNCNKGVEHQNITRVSSWKEIKDVIDKL